MWADYGDEGDSVADDVCVDYFDIMAWLGYGFVVYG